GFDRSAAMTFGFVMRAQRFPTPASMHNFVASVWTSLESDPTIRTAGLTTALPLSGQNVENQFTIDCAPVTPRGDPPLSAVRGGAGHYMAGMGGRLLEGRELLPTDTATAQPVVVVTRDFALKYVKATSPIGVRISMGGPDSGDPWRTIVGVVESIHHNAMDKE